MPGHERHREHHARACRRRAASAWSTGRRSPGDVRPIARRVGITAPLDAEVKGLSTAENWLITICRALVRKARLIVMDEPTASLSAAESERLFAIIDDLARSGVAVLYVSHRLDEILRLCRPRHGVPRRPLGGTSSTGPGSRRAGLVEAIVGGRCERLDAHPRGPTRREVVAAASQASRAVRRSGSVSFELHRGEVLGLGGLVGAGRSELARLIFGADRPTPER